MLFRSESDDIKNKSKPVHPALNWKVTNLPPGFTPDYQHRLKMRTSRKSSNQLVYSDGLASISVFIENNKGNFNLTGHVHMGAVNVHGKNFKDFHVTAVGEVPYATVKMISESVVLNGSSENVLFPR